MVRRRRLLNHPTTAVAEMLEGYVAAHRHLIRLDEHGNVVRAEPKERGKVGLVIGNGSGHEPAMIGWVGPGLFDVNVPGPIFTAPGPDALLRGIEAADRGAGVLLCVSQHAGDVMSARLAYEMALDRGLHAEMVLLYDDVTSAPRDQAHERRGGAGLFFVWKIVGALAESGASLAECRQMAEHVRDNVRTTTAAFGTVVNPASGEPLGDGDDDRLVVGVGVHGESGGAVAAAPTADELAELMTKQLLDDGGYAPGDEVCVLLNNAGAMTVMELAVLYRRVAAVLADRQISVHRVWIGAYATTQDLAGFALAICRVDELMRQLYDAPAVGAAFVVPAADELVARR
ncbi:MAG: dihydroxyacetone kinase subunit DhaK [Acidimicrobiales bacterium]